MPFSDVLARLEAAVFDRLGENAAWQDVGTVRVLRREADEELPFTHGGAIVTGHRIKVRRSEVTAPAQGQTVQILDSSGSPLAGALYTLVSEPRIDRKGTWTCIVEPVA